MEVTISDSSEGSESAKPLLPLESPPPQETKEETAEVQEALVLGEIKQSLLQIQEAQKIQEKSILEARKENLETHNLVQSLGEAVETFLNEEDTEETVTANAVTVDVQPQEQKSQEAPAKPPGILRRVFLGR
jgi:hypothetical protein